LCAGCNQGVTIEISGIVTLVRQIVGRSDHLAGRVTALRRVLQSWDRHDDTKCLTGLSVLLSGYAIGPAWFGGPRGERVAPGEFAAAARMQRYHLAKGKSIMEIARDLKVSRNTVRKDA
jgi:hypothetical protein